MFLSLSPSLCLDFLNEFVLASAHNNQFHSMSEHINI